jgi:sugar phosphate permease
MSQFAISSVVGAPLAGVLTDTVFRDRNRSVFLIGFALSTAAYPAVLSSAVHGHRGVLAGTLLAAGLANPFADVTLMGIAAKQVDVGTVGRSSGLWMSVSFLAGAAGVLVGSLALRALGDFNISLMIAGLASVAGFCASLLLQGGNSGLHRSIRPCRRSVSRSILRAQPRDMHCQEML